MGFEIGYGCVCGSGGGRHICHKNGPTLQIRHLYYFKSWLIISTVLNKREEKQ